MEGFERFCWLATILSAAAAAGVLILDGPPLAVAVAVIPYVFTRGVQAWVRGGLERPAAVLAEAAALSAPPPVWLIRGCRVLAWAAIGLAATTLAAGVYFAEQDIGQTAAARTATAPSDF